MNKSVYHGIDIGSKNLKFISVSYDPEKNSHSVLRKISYESQGVKNGYISNPELFHKSLKSALEKYEKEIKQPITEVILSINSLGLKTKDVKVLQQTIDQIQITEADLEEVEKKVLKHVHEKVDEGILDFWPLKYIINKYEYFSGVEGLKAKKFEVEYIFITIPENHIGNLEKVFEKEDILITAPIFTGNKISAEMNSEMEDKNLGFLNIDFGAKLTSLSIWENDKMLAFEVLKFGSDDITKKISLEKKISFNEAEKIKESFEKDSKLEKIITFEIKKLAEKIQIFLNENTDGLLPGGAVLYGGGSKLKNISEILKDELSLPVKNYSKDISDSKTDYYNIYAAVMHNIYASKTNRFSFGNVIFKKIKKIFSKNKI